MNGSIDDAGYATVSLTINSKLTVYRTHRLMAYTFLGLDPEANLVVNHDNGIKHDNQLLNLEVTTYAGNSQHAVNTGLRKTRKVRQLDTNGNIIAIYDSIAKAGRAMKISGCHISNVCRGEKATAGGFRWIYND